MAPIVSGPLRNMDVCFIYCFSRLKFPLTSNCRKKLESEVPLWSPESMRVASEPPLSRNRRPYVRGLLNRRCMHALAFVATLASTFPLQVKANFYEQPSNITVLTTATFNATLSRGDDVAWFVEFYADWCHTCNALRPTWITIADTIASPQNSHLQDCVKLAAVSCEDHPEVCRSQKIPAYPELTYYPPGRSKGHGGGASRVSYHGVLYPLAVAEWVQLLTGPIKGLDQAFSLQR
eukprot:jgi/Bigna1/139468/aug1.50_g14176